MDEKTSHKNDQLNSSILFAVVFMKENWLIICDIECYETHIHNACNITEGKGCLHCMKLNNKGSVFQFIGRSVLRN